MQRVGELLKAEREKKGLSLHEIGMTLKINPKILKAIEDNDSANLPAKTFLRGFVRSYAQYLRLDVQGILNQLQSEIGSTRPEEPVVKIEPVITTAPAAETTAPSAAPKSKPLAQDTGLSGPKIFTALGVVVLIVLIIFVAKMVDKYQKESKTPSVPVNSEAEVTTALPSPTPPLATMETPPPADDGLATPMNPETAKPILAVSVPTPTVVPRLTPSPTPKPTATPTPSVTPSPTPSPTASPKATATPQASPTPVASATPAATDAAVKPLRPVEVIIEALNKVEVKYSFGDDKFQTITLMADEVHTFKSKTGVSLELSDGGAVSLIVNGRERGVPGKMGQPLKLSYPK